MVLLLDAFLCLYSLLDWLCFFLLFSLLLLIGLMSNHFQVSALFSDVCTTLSAADQNILTCAGCDLHFLSTDVLTPSTAWQCDDCTTKNQPLDLLANSTNSTFPALVEVNERIRAKPSKLQLFNNGRVLPSLT